MEALPQTLKLLGDTARLRLLALLEQQELSVQELVSITGMGQSRVSRHLGLLRSAEMIRDRKEGTWTFYRLIPPSAESAISAELWVAIKAGIEKLPHASQDQAALESAMKTRQDQILKTHDRLAGVWRVLGEDLEKGSLRAEAVAAMASSKITVADLGCGAGFFTEYLARRVDKVIAVDPSSAMLIEARSAIAQQGLASQVDFRAGELGDLPLRDQEVDAIFANLVLHHLVDFGSAINEIARILKPGGTVVITDLEPHQEDWMREEMGDLRLGINSAEVLEAFRRGPFVEVTELQVEDRYRMKSARGHLAKLEMFMVRAIKK